MSHRNKLTLANAKNFIFGGKATITLKNNATEERRTYKITQPKKEKDNDKAVYWVSVMTGSDNEKSYSFIGSVFGKDTYRHSAKSKLNPQNTSVRGFEYLLNAIKTDKIAPTMEIWHEGVCCRCGRKLTVPESIETGIGPECSKIKAARNNRQSKLF
jgi:hypothetical protein